MSSIKFRLHVLFVLIISVLLLAFWALNYFRTKAALGRLSTKLPSVLWNFDKNQINEAIRQIASGMLALR